ncbi:MAG: methylated-DNA--[protein]-cysteine S-methyltransferase [Planctomycetes bacterium]|nr:methylated-DNA--[protein]-cysteine S-methyltransferase [Planctomycetota bacterium]
MVFSIHEDTGTEKSVEEAFRKAARLTDGTDYPLTLQAGWLDSPIGTVLVAGDEAGLRLVLYTDQNTMIRKLALVQKKLKARLELASSPVVDSARRELEEYFAGVRRTFETPLALSGTVFQERVWQALREIPYGETATYADLAGSIGKPAAFRAVAQANAQNPIDIIVPGHRVVNTGGEIGGYNAGVDRKKWLLEFEQNNLAKNS